MPARSPEEARTLWVKAYNAGDLEAALALYEPTAVMLHGDAGMIATGTSAIRKHLEEVFAFRATFHTETVKTVTEDLEDVQMSASRLKNRQPPLTTEQARKALGLEH